MIYEEISSVYGFECPSRSTFKQWKKELKCGGADLQNDPKEYLPTSLEPFMVVKWRK
jgi:hypothetical protein